MGRHVIDVCTSITLSALHSGCDVVATGGMITITLPAPIADCDIRVINGEQIGVGATQGNGKILVGFPADVNSTLYPGQAVAVNSDGKAWFTEEKPGRFKCPPAYQIYIANPGGLDTNDGLTAATPIQSWVHMRKIVQEDLDYNQSAPICSVAVGSEFVNDWFNYESSPLGAALIQISTNGNGSFTWRNDGPCVSVGDGAFVYFNWNGLFPHGTARLIGNTANAPSTGTIFIHNNGGVDMTGDPPTFVGSGPNCAALFFDGPTAGASISSGFNIEEVFGDVFHMDEGGGRFTIGGPINPVNDANGNPPSVTRLFGIYGANELIRSDVCAMGGYASCGPSVVGGKAEMVTNGVSTPGGVVAIEGGVVLTSKFT